MVVKEQFGVYQQGNRTTIVIYNMRPATKQKLLDVIFSDLKTENTEYMTDKPQEITDLEPENVGFDLGDPTLPAESELVNSLIRENTDLTIRAMKLVEVYNSGIEEDVPFAADEIRRIITEIGAADPPTIKYFLFGLRNQDPAYTLLASVLRQKGAGDGLKPFSEEHEKAVFNVLNGCSEEELHKILDALYNKI